MKKTIYNAIFLILINIQPLFAQWSELGGLNGLAADDLIHSLCSDASGNIYAAGYFTNSSAKRYVSKYDGNAWSELGGLNGLAANDWIHPVCIDASGNIYAAGLFTNSSGNKYVAKYDGSTWSELGGLNGLAANGAIFSVWSDASENIYAAGFFTNSSGNRYVAKYDGSAWSELGGMNGLAANGTIFSVCSDASGNIYTAGQFTNSSGNWYVAKYDGSIWSELGGLNGLAANNEITTVCSDASGNIYVGGQFTNSSGNRYVAKYNGSAWSELGGLNGLAANGQILPVYSDASGNIYAAGWFTNSSGYQYVAKYDGNAWSELGVLNGLAANSYIRSVCRDASGNIYTAGWFTNSSGNRYVARYGSATGISFSSSDTNVCEKFCVDFSDQSSGNTVGWQWNFEGGNPTSSTDQNPSNICYEDSGVFDVSLITTDASGNSDTLVLTDFITVYPNPLAPTITQNGNVLNCSNAAFYQWYLNSVLIPGATNQSYTITQSGLYTVVITNENGCEAQTDFDATLVGMNEVTPESISIFPNPAFDQLEISSDRNSISQIMITDILGETLLRFSFPPSQKEIILSLADLSSGIYLLQLISDDGIAVKKIAKE